MVFLGRLVGPLAGHLQPVVNEPGQMLGFEDKDPSKMLRFLLGAVAFLFLITQNRTFWQKLVYD